MLLIMDIWVNGEIPDDDDILAKICQTDKKTWKKERKNIEIFFKIEKGKWVHERVEKELKIARENSEKASAKARAGAAKRWGIEKNNDARRDATSMLQALPEALPEHINKESPSPSPSPIKSKAIQTPPLRVEFVSEKIDRGLTKSPNLKPDDVELDVWNDFNTLRKAKKAPITTTVLRGIRGQAEAAKITLNEALTICCQNGWQSFQASWLENLKSKNSRSFGQKRQPETIPEFRARIEAQVERIKNSDFSWE